MEGGTYDFIKFNLKFHFQLCSIAVEHDLRENRVSDMFWDVKQLEGTKWKIKHGLLISLDLPVHFQLCSIDFTPCSMFLAVSSI